MHVRRTGDPMSLLQEATGIEQSAAKIAAFGQQGSGKSFTMALLAIALSKTYHNSAPVAWFDTEAASDWLLDIFKAEGVKLLRAKRRAFVDMRTTLSEAEDAGACVFLADSYSHPWAELQASLKTRLKVNKLEFHHMQELQLLWQAWVDQFLASPLHCLLSGRLAYEWENDVDEETGKMGFHKAGTKMKSQGDAGYEPSLLLELEAVRVLDEVIKTKKGSRRVTKKAGGHFLHRLHVLKDRSRALNGQMFEFSDADVRVYKPGGWQPVFKALQPHFSMLNIKAGVQNVVNTSRTSSELFSDGGSQYRARGQRKDIALGELQGILMHLWPGQKDDAKKLRAAIGLKLFDVYSWEGVAAKSLEQLEQAVAYLRLLKEQLEKMSDAPTGEEGILNLLGLCQSQLDDADAPAIKLAAAAGEIF